jgi:tetratricopeptide (TPR) repeat protein
MPPFQLYTRKDVRLVESHRVILRAKREGPRPLRDGAPIADAAQDDGVVALLVLLALAGPAGMSTDELLLYLTPELTRERGRAELSRLASALGGLLGDGAIAGTTNGLALRPDLVALDVSVVDREVPADDDFLATFDISKSPELGEWIEAMRRRVVPVAVDDGERTARAGRSLGGHRMRAYAGIGLAIVALTAAGVSIATPGSVKGFASGDPLLLAAIQNETGDSLLGAGVAAAATVALQQSPHLRLYPAGQVRAVYRLMKLPNLDTTLTFPLAREVAQRGHVRFVLGLEIGRAGERYRVRANLADVAHEGTVYTMTAEAPAKTDILDAVDRVLIDTRRRLGESRRAISDRRLPLPLVTTASLEALRSYAEGSSAWSHGKYREAAELWGRAVDLDTGFAMAYGALGIARYYNHDRDAGDRYMREAFLRANRLTEWESLRLRAEQAAFTGMADSAIALGRVVATRYPNAITWYDYGNALRAADRDSEAQIAYEKSLAFDSTRTNTYINLALLARSRSDYEKALELYAHAARFDSAQLYNGNVNLEWGSTFVYLGRFAEAESAFARMSRVPGLYARNLGFRALGSLAMWQGRGDQAIAWFQKALDASMQDDASLSQLRNRLFLASAYRSVGRTREADAEVTKAVEIARDPRTEPRPLALVATSCIKQDRVADAEMLLRLVRTRVGARDPADSAALAYVAALVHFDRHRLDSAMVYVRRAARLPERVPLLALRAEVYRAAGMADSARIAIEEALKERAFGLEAQEDYLRAPLVLGDLLIAQNDTVGAMKQYRRVIEERKGAQKEVVDVAAARTRIDLLTRR